MSLTVNYASTRSEVWRHYRRLWAERLWKLHALIFVATATTASFILYGRTPDNAFELLAVMAISAAPLGLFALYPMLMFKPQKRTLTVDSTGISTVIGQRGQTLAWNEIASVRNDETALIIQRHNLNAFIIPARAFETPAAMEAFEVFVRSQLTKASTADSRR